MKTIFHEANFERVFIEYPDKVFGRLLGKPIEYLNDEEMLCMAYYRTHEPAVPCTGMYVRRVQV